MRSSGAGRRQIRQIHLQGRAITLVDHTHRADQESLQILADDLRVHYADHRRLLVLAAWDAGDQEHLDVPETVAKAEPQAVYTVGTGLRDASVRLPQEVHSAHLSSIDQLRAVLDQDCRDGDVLALHGSTRSGLRRLGRELRAASARATRTESWHMVISGDRVHGVGFRRWLRRQALRGGLTGWVRNRTDRTVEAVITGHGPAVDAVLAQVYTGPRRARVRRVVSRRRSSSDGPAGFEIRADRRV